MPRQSKRQRLSRRASPAAGPRLAASDGPLRRPLRLELLEDRRLLTGVVVNNILDVVNGDTLSIAHLIANNGGDGISLREAILAANAAASEKADEITFDAALSGATITLGGTALPITEVLTIDARPLAENLTINANLLSRIFNINESAGDVTLGGLTLTGGRTTGNNSSGNNTFSGGAIRSLTSGNLTLDQSTVSGNSTLGARARGGGIYAYGSMTLTQCTVSENRTGGYFGTGGGISSRGDVTLTQSTVSGNSTEGDASAGGGIYAFSSATLTQCTVSGNSTEGNTSAGGGIYAFSSATLTQCTVSGNSTAGILGGVGGGIASANFATLIQSTVSGNSTAGGAADGGGIFAGSVTLTECIVSGNRTAADGGGIFAAGSAMLARSTVSGNRTATDGDRGGGIYAGGSVTLNQSTVSGNSTQGLLAHGGGIYAGGSVTLNQSTVSGNYTSLLFEARGGGIFSRGAVTLTQSTVTRNRSVDNVNFSSQGGGVYQANTASNHPFSISGSIVAQNLAGGGGYDLVKDFDSTLTVNYSLIGLLVTPNMGGNNVVTDNPQLGGLANNGGPTQTHALLAGSPAINAGDPTIPFNSMQFDQRGAPFVGVFGGRIDIGAFESQTTASANFVPDAFVDGFDFLTWQRGFGSTGAAATFANGNADFDSDIDADDLGVWKLTFGNPALVAAPAASAGLVASDSPSRLSPQAVDAALAWQMAAEAPASRPLFRPRWLRAR